MYRWREMSPEQRQQVLAYRRSNQLPWHSVPHFESDTPYYMVTAACYEHRPVVGESPERMADFEKQLVETVQSHSSELFAWVLLPGRLRHFG
jgi:putative transposase